LRKENPSVHSEKTELAGDCYPNPRWLQATRASLVPK